MLLLMLRSALFAFVGFAFFVYWVVADPSFEDSASQSEWSLQMSWVFFVFILGTAFMQLGLVALTGVIAFSGRGGYRLLALVPAGTIAAIILFVVAGGPIMLATWLTAAMLALTLPTSTTAQAARATP